MKNSGLVKKYAKISVPLMGVFACNAGINASLVDMGGYSNLSPGAMNIYYGALRSTNDLYPADIPMIAGAECFIKRAESNKLVTNSLAVFSYSGLFTNVAIFGDWDELKSLGEERKYDIIQDAVSECAKSYDMSAVKQAVAMKGIKIT
jgi:hypothetical protein